MYRLTEMRQKSVFVVCTLGHWFSSCELHVLRINGLPNELMSVLASSEYKPVKYINIFNEHKSTLKEQLSK